MSGCALGPQDIKQFRDEKFEKKCPGQNVQDNWSQTVFKSDEFYPSRLITAKQCISLCGLLNTNQLVKSSVTLKCTVMEAKSNMLFTQKCLLQTEQWKS